MYQPSSPWLSELRQLLRLAAPLAAAHAGNQLMGLVDTAIVGRLGAVELGAVGLANSLFFPLTVLGMGAMMGLDPLVSQALGAGDAVRARKLLWQGVWMAVLVGLVLSVPIGLAPSLLVPFGIEPAVAAKASSYLYVRLIGLVPALLFVGVRSYLQSIGSTRPMLIAVVAANIFNVAATLFLVYGGGSLPAWAGPLRHFPALGVEGAALATTLCTLLQVGIVAAAVRAAAVPGFERGDRRFDPIEFRRGLKVGAPIGLQLGAEVGVFALVGLLVGKLGTHELAAHQISLTLASFTFTVAMGVGAAASVRVGRAIGAGDTPAARLAGIVGLAGGGGMMTLGALLFVLIPAPLAALLTDEPEVIGMAVPLLLVAAVFQISDGLQAVGAGVLRGAGDTRFPFVANVVGHYAVGLPVGIALGMWFGFGVGGLWWGLCTGLTAVASTLTVRFLRLSSRPIRPLAASAAVAAEPAAGA
ncbi:MATE family efflux transporter [Vulgatibacter sp.]|uniref:MATE family efflux transporter n=1 Tax=Vulgatibacter sp. TaxID=1971226 RepID=UPI00356B2283